MWNRVEFKWNGKAAFKRNYGMSVLVTFVTTTLISGIATMIQTGAQPATEGEASGGAAMLAFVVSLLVLLLNIFVTHVLEVSNAKFFIMNQSSAPGFDVVFEPFKSRGYLNTVKTLFLRDLYVFLWTLLGVVPGIIVITIVVFLCTAFLYDANGFVVFLAVVLIFALIVACCIPGVIKSYEYRMMHFILAENPEMPSKEVFAISKAMMNGRKKDLFVLDLSFIGWSLLSGLTCGILGIFYVSPYIYATQAEVYAFNKAEAFRNGTIR